MPCRTVVAPLWALSPPPPEYREGAAGPQLADSEYLEVDRPSESPPAKIAETPDHDPEHSQRSLKEILAIIQK